MAIHIKKSHRGLLHKNLGIKQGEKIPASKLKVKSTDSAAVKKRKIFAQNAKKWNHADDGIEIAPIHEKQPSIYDQVPQYDIDAINQHGAPSFSLQQPQQSFNQPVNWGNAGLAGLLAVDTLIPSQKTHSPVVRPSMTYNQHPYGTGSSAIMKYGGAVDTGNTQWLVADEYAKNGMYVPSSYNFGGYVGHTTEMANMKNYDSGGCMDCGGKMPFGGNVPPSQETMNRYSPWGNLASTVQGEGWNATPLKDYTEYTPSYNAAGNNIMIDGQNRGNVVVRGGKSGLFDILVRDRSGQHPDSFVKQGIDAQHAHDYFVNPASTVAGRVEQLKSSVKDSKSFSPVMEEGGEIEEAKSGNWIKGAVNPKHKGFCTPLSKKTCTPRRKAFAMTMKKHHGFHEDGGKLQNYYEEGGTYDMTKEQMQSLISQGYDIQLL